MRSYATIIVRSTVALAMMVGIAQVGRITRGITESRSQLRVAVRTRAASADRCRERTAEELQKLPMHMRQKMACERGWIAYNFSVGVNGQIVDQRTVSPAGAFGDRPLVLSSDTWLEPGAHIVQIQLSPDASAGVTDTVKDMAFHQTITFTAGRAVLVMLEPDGSWQVRN